MDNKAVSPLIATVLLIAFAVALGAVVMNWGKAYVEDTAQDVGDKSAADVSCQMDVEIDIKEISGTPKLCYNNTSSATSVQLMVENKGNIKVQKLSMVVIGENDQINTTDIVNSSISVGSIFKKVVTYGTNYGNIQQIEIRPYIKPEGLNSNVLCSDAGIVEDDVVQCS